jgi:hypothetical protein
MCEHLFQDILFLADFHENLHFLKKSSKKSMCRIFSLRENENVLLMVAKFFGAMDKSSLDDSRENFPENEISRIFVKNFRKISHLLANGKGILDSTRMILGWYILCKNI